MVFKFRGFPSRPLPELKNFGSHEREEGGEEKGGGSMSSPTAAIFPAITRTSARKEASPLTTVPPWESLVWGEKKVTEVSVSVEVEAEVEVKKKARSIGEKNCELFFFVPTHFQQQVWRFQCMREDVTG